MYVDSCYSEFVRPCLTGRFVHTLQSTLVYRVPFSFVFYPYHETTMSMLVPSIREPGLGPSLSKLSDDMILDGMLISHSAGDSHIFFQSRFLCIESCVSCGVFAVLTFTSLWICASPCWIRC